MIDTDSAQLVEACERRHANQSLRRKPVPELVHLVDLFVLEGSADRSAAESLTTVVFSLPTSTSVQVCTRPHEAFQINACNFRPIRNEDKPNLPTNTTGQ